MSYEFSLIVKPKPQLRTQNRKCAKIHAAKAVTKDQFGFASGAHTGCIHECIAIYTCLAVRRQEYFLIFLFLLLSCARKEGANRAEKRPRSRSRPIDRA